MSRTFAYCRVSTTEQTTENQALAIASHGYQVEPHRMFSETVSGGVMAMKRREFPKMVERMEKGDVLVVLKVDRLGRDAIDILSTTENLLARGITVISLDLPVPDLSKPEGKMMLGMFSVFAEFERGRITERTREGLERAKAEGVKLGRPAAKETLKKVQQCKKMGLTQAEAASHLSISTRTVKRHWHS